MGYDTRNLTSRFEPQYEINEQVVHDFVKIMVTIMYGKRIKLKCKKYSFEGIRNAVFSLCRIFKNSLTWNFLVYDDNDVPVLVNKVSKIGNWLWLKGLRYPHFLYQIFPPYFGNRHTSFMETMFTVLNAFEMPKCDWETLLDYFDNLKNEKDRKHFKKFVDDASDAMYKSYLAERYVEYKLFSKKKEQ